MRRAFLNGVRLERELVAAHRARDPVAVKRLEGEVAEAERVFAEARRLRELLLVADRLRECRGCSWKCEDAWLDACEEAGLWREVRAWTGPLVELGVREPLFVREKPANRERLRSLVERFNRAVDALAASAGRASA